MSFSLKQKALHFSTADLNTLNKGLHPTTPSPSTHGGNRDGEVKRAGGRAKPELAPAWAGLAWRLLHSSLPSSSPRIPADPSGLHWVRQGLVGRSWVPLPQGWVPDAMVFSRHHFPRRSAAVRCRRSQRGRSTGEWGQQESHSSPGEDGWWGEAFRPLAECSVPEGSPYDVLKEAAGRTPLVPPLPAA